MVPQKKSVVAWPKSLSKSSLQLSQSFPTTPPQLHQVPAQVLVDPSKGVAVARVQLVPFQDLASKLCEASSGRAPA